MTCQKHIDAGAADRIQYAALDRLTERADLHFGPALNTSNPHSYDAISTMIASRAKQMPFRSNESRKRYLEIHRTLATAICSGVHDGR